MSPHQSTNGVPTGGLRIIGRLPEGHIIMCRHGGDDYTFLVRSLGISVECPRCGATCRGTELAEQTCSLRRRPGYADATTITAFAQPPGPDPKPGNPSAPDAPGPDAPGPDAPDWPPDEPREPPRELPPGQTPERPPGRPPADPPVPPAVLRVFE